MSADKQICLVVLRNIFTNACFFSKDGGVITFSVKELHQGDIYEGKQLTSDFFLISISDNGIGIPEADKEKIFSKLFKASNATNEESKGSGLGLFITREILTKVGGEIWFTSAQDVGSTFYIAFPKNGMQKKEGHTTLD